MGTTTTNFGVLTAEVTNIFGGISNVQSKNGALILESRFMRSSQDAFTIGNIITVGRGASPQTISHEFGHYIQSRRFGPLAGPIFLIPSGTRVLLMKTGIIAYPTDYDKFYTESDATKLGQRYWHP